MVGIHLLDAHPRLLLFPHHPQLEHDDDCSEDGKVGIKVRLPRTDLEILGVQVHAGLELPKADGQNDHARASVQYLPQLPRRPGEGDDARDLRFHGVRIPLLHRRAEEAVHHLERHQQEEDHPDDVMRIGEVLRTGAHRHGRDGEDEAQKDHEERRHVGEDVDVDPRAGDEGPEPRRRHGQGGGQGQRQRGQEAVRGPQGAVGALPRGPLGRAAGTAVAGGQVEPERPLLGMVGQGVAVSDGVQEVDGRRGVDGALPVLGEDLGEGHDRRGGTVRLRDGGVGQRLPRRDHGGDGRRPLPLEVVLERPLPIGGGQVRPADDGLGIFHLAVGGETESEPGQAVVLELDGDGRRDRRVVGVQVVEAVVHLEAGR